MKKAIKQSTLVFLLNTVSIILVIGVMTTFFINVGLISKLIKPTQIDMIWLSTQTDF